MRDLYLLIFLLVCYTCSFAQTASAPVITSFTPASGALGTTVTITGRNFSTNASANIVFFGGVKAQVLSVNTTGTQLVVKVHAGATYHPITVSTNRGTAYSKHPFIVTFPCGAGDFTASSFAPKIDIPTPTNPYGVSIADMDLDGKPDLVVSNGADVPPIPGDVPNNTISIHPNNSISGNFVFGARTDFQTGEGAWGLAVGHLDLDGKLDIATANINMASSLNLNTNSGSAGIAIRDVDGDGMVDVVIANDTRTLSIIRNTTVTGNISFADKVDYAIKGASYSISISDLDGDGKLDFVTANYEPSSVSVFRNNSTIGNILLDARQDFTTGDNPFYATIGDIDGDGKTRFDCNKCRFINRFDF